MKNIILIKNRMFDYYDFNALKRNSDVNVTIVTFKKNLEHLGDEIKLYVDSIYGLEDTPSPFDSPLPIEQLTDIVAKTIEINNKTWIVAADELNTISAAKLRKIFNLPGLLPPTVFNYRNKVRQKEILSKAGIKTPKFISITKSPNSKDEFLAFQHITKELDIPFLLKPIDMGGSTAVEKIDTYLQYNYYFKKYTYFSNFIAEEFIRGQLYHCDFIIKNNTYVFCEVSEYIHNGLSFMQGHNHGSLLLTEGNPLRFSISEFCKSANTVLGLSSGCGHFEVFVTSKQEIVFIEAAARPAGSLVPIILSKTFKNNFLNAALLAEIEENPGYFQSPTEYNFWAVFPKENGIVKGLKIPSLKSRFEIGWLVEKGCRLEKSKSVSDRSGYLIAYNSDRNKLEEDFNYLRSFNAIEIDKKSIS